MGSVSLVVDLLLRTPLFSLNEKVFRAVRDAIYMKGDM